MKNWSFKYITASDLDPFIPEIWANESIALLIENMVIGNLVHRDFEDEMAKYGDIVNTRSLGTFVSKRKVSGEDVTTQDATSENIQVKLDQHQHVSFYIYDEDDTLAFKDLVTQYLEPAIIAVAQAIDKIILGQHVQFEANTAGALGGLTNLNAKAYVLETRKVMNVNKCPLSGRNFIVGATTESTLLSDDTFLTAHTVGDDGTALREASLGRKLGFDFFMCQSMSEFSNLDKETATTINNAAGYAVGATQIVLTAANANVGDMLTVVGDMTPQRVTALTNSDKYVTITPGLRHAVAHGAAVVIYASGLVNQATATAAAGGSAGVAGYRQFYHKGIILDGLPTAPSVCVGMQVVFGTASVAAATDAKYTIIAVDAVGADAATITLDRPLEEAIVNNALVSFYPSGEYNFAFQRESIALVTRPLKSPRTGAGALSAVVNYNGLAVRVTITYDGKAQGHLVTVDMLCGVKVLNANRGVVMYA